MAFSCFMTTKYQVASYDWYFVTTGESMYEDPKLTPEQEDEIVMAFLMSDNQHGKIQVLLKYGQEYRAQKYMRELHNETVTRNMTSEQKQRWLQMNTQ